MDLALESGKTLFLSKTTKSFNPCFNGSCSRISYREKRNCEQSIVSILVLMDLALECPHLWKKLTGNDCFNPCFNGSCSRITGLPRKIKSDLAVSILVLMDLALECGAYHMQQHQHNEFQSLF